MTIELDDKSYIVGIWFSSNPKTNSNWLGCVIKDPDNPKKYKGWSRFRYAKDRKIFDSNDEKKWNTFISAENKTENDMIEIMKGLQSSLDVFFPEKDKIIVKGNLIKLIKLSKRKKWMNMMIKKSIGE